MSELREPMHQPPNPDDLRRAPPASPDCARVRGWLRDFVDRDLDPRRAAELEEHVHRCRTCAVELARTEHETMRLRSALAELAGAHALPTDFAARVVERLVVDETSLVPKETIARAAALATAQAEAGAAPARQRETGPRVQPVVLLIASVLVLWGLTFGVEVFGDLFQDPRHEGRLVVVAATDAFSGDRRLGLGDGLGEKQALHVRLRGAARVQLYDATMKSQPAALLQVHPEGEVCLVQGAPRLHGQVDVETSRSVSVTMSDGSHIDLGVGAYAIVASLHDDDPLSSLPPELRVRVEVRSGEPASIVRSGFGPTLVAAGQLGIFQGNGPTSVVVMGGSGPDVAAAPITPRQQNPEVAPEPALLIARALDQTGGPVSANVRLKGGRSHAVNTSVNIGEDGTMLLQLNARIDTDYLFASAVAPDWRDDLGVLARDAYRVMPQGPNQALMEPLQFRTSSPYYGQVLDEASVVCEDVQVVPCIVDDLFGAVWPMLEQRVVSNTFGAFRCMRLPAKLPPHQSLRLLLLRHDLEPTVVAIPERAGPLSTVQFPPIVMKHTHSVGIHLLSANSEVEILEEIPSLPQGTGFVRRTATTDGSGAIADLHVGGGTLPSLWWRDPQEGHNMLRQLSIESFGTVWVYRPVLGDAVPFASRFGATTPIASTNAELVTTCRHDSIADVGEGTVPMVLQFSDSYGYPVIAQVFVVDGASSYGRTNAHFAGFTAADGVVNLRRRADQTIIAISPDGNCAVVGSQSMPTSPLAMPLNGTLQVHSSLRPGPSAPPVMWLHLRRSGLFVPGQTLATTRIAAAATGWEVHDLVPGVYNVTIGPTTYPPVTVPAGGSVLLQP